MRTKSFIVAFALGVFLVGTGFILQVARATHETERAIHNRTAQRAELEARLTTAGARLAAAEKDRKDLEQTLQNLRAKPTAAAANAPRSEGSSSASDVQAGSLNDPRVQILQLASSRASLGPLYGPLFGRLGLSAAKAEQAVALLAKRAEKNMDLSAAARSQGLKPDDVAILTLKQKADEEFRLAQTEVLGDAGYQQLQSYERELPIRAYVDQFAGTVAMAGTPITGEQADLLVALMLNTSSEYQAGGQPTLMSMDWEKILSRAPGVLSAAQVDAFKYMGMRSQIRRRLHDMAQVSASSPSGL